RIYSRGAFACLVEGLRQGRRVIVGPAPRVKRDAVRTVLEQHIAAAKDGTLALSSDEQADLLFRYWHSMNDRSLLEGRQGSFWKASVYYRPHPEELLIRLFQGPVWMVWPQGNLNAFHGDIDRDLVLRCCKHWRDIGVIRDSKDALALTLTRDGRWDAARVS